MNIFKKLFSFLFLVEILTAPIFLYAENVINLNANSLLPKSELFITPRSGNFLVGSTFEVPVYLDTKGNNINTVSLKINFDPKKLSIIKPSGGKSIFGIWAETPSYDNTLGTASLVGIIPGGIVTSSGLIATITFKALASGTTKINITNYSSANLNDGLGSEVKLILTGATYTLTPKPPEGVIVYSETHPSQDRWYNNNSPILNWEGQDNKGFNFTIDHNPQTILPNIINTADLSTFYENISDGVWYFHIKANKENVWGNTSNFQLKIDTTPPAQFIPTASTLKDSGDSKKYLLSFFTTDTLSGIDHYEVGVINKKEEATVSPVFIETESPYLIPIDIKNEIRVLVRAFDTAGNLRESYIDLFPSYTIMSVVKKYSVYILFGFIALLILELLMHFLFGHHILINLRKAYQLFKKISSGKKQDEIIKEVMISNPSEKIPTYIINSPNNLEETPKPPIY